MREDRCDPVQASNMETNIHWASMITVSLTEKKKVGGGDPADTSFTFHNPFFLLRAYLEVEQTFHDYKAQSPRKNGRAGS